MAAVGQWGLHGRAVVMGPGCRGSTRPDWLRVICVLMLLLRVLVGWWGFFLFGWFVFVVLFYFIYLQTLLFAMCRMMPS